MLTTPVIRLSFSGSLSEFFSIQICLMKFVLLFLGKTRERYIQAGIRDYAQRLNRYLPVDLVVLKEKTRPSMTDAQQKALEGRLLLERCGAGAMKVALDARGQQPDSLELAKIVGGWEMRGVKKVVFLIGGPLGLAPEVLDQADFVLSLSRLTFTHELSRMLLLEQLYRAFSIKAGHRYHRE